MKDNFEIINKVGIICTITYKNQEFIGCSYCHPDDTDCWSERTGCHIAKMRAMLEVDRYIRDNELKPQLTVLYHIWDCYESSEKYDKYSNTATLVWKEINRLEEELRNIRIDISKIRSDLREYLKLKDKAFNRYRMKQKDKTV